MTAYTGAGARPGPVPLPDGGVYVPAALTAELAGALELLQAFVAGTAPPAACRAPRMSLTALAVLSAARDAAVTYRRAESQRANAAATIPPATVLAPAIAPARSDSEITAASAATVIGVSEARVRQLASAGVLQGHKGPRDIWLLDPDDVRAYAVRRRTRRSGHARAGHPGGEARGSAA